MFDVTKVLEQYKNVKVPAKGQTMEFKIPCTSKPLQFSRPFVDEEEEALCDWSLPITFFTIQKKHLFKLFVASLLEKKIAIVCEDLRILSSLVFSFIPLLRPFIYQSVIIPILPAKLNSLVDAPVPFIIGFTSKPPNIPPDVIVFDLEEKTLKITEILPDLPKFREFEVEFLKYYNQLIRTYDPKKTPYATTSKQLRLAKHISGLFEKYLSSLFDGFRNYCIRDLTQRNNPITIFMKDQFLESIPKVDHSFYNNFLQTQMFFDYQDKRLRREDSRKKFA